MQELKTLLYENINRPIFNSTFSTIVSILNFINQFFCVSNTKINYCEFHFVNELLAREFNEEYLEVFFNNEINIELNYTNTVSIYDKNLDNFINSPQVAYNRFLVLYHEIFNKISPKQLNILFNICNDNDRLINSLISAALSSHNLEKVIMAVINTHHSTNLSKTFIYFIVSYREEFLNLYYNLFEKLSI